MPPVRRELSAMAWAHKLPLAGLPTNGAAHVRADRGEYLKLAVRSAAHIHRLRRNHLAPSVPDGKGDLLGYRLFAAAKLANISDM